jgi:AraC-like DNA-binding protein
VAEQVTVKRVTLHDDRIVAFVREEAMRRLSEPMWARFGIVFAKTIPSAVELLSRSPGGILVFDPGLSELACETLIATALEVGAEVILCTRWEHAIMSRVLAITKLVTPIDVVALDADDLPERLAALLSSSRVSAVEAAVLAALAEAVLRLPLAERAFIVDALASPVAPRGVTTLIREHGLAARTLERHFARAGIAPPRDILRASAVARGRRLLLDSRVPVGMVAERCGLHSQSGMIDAFNWAVGLPPRTAVRQLEAREFAARLSDILLLK